MSHFTLSYLLDAVLRMLDLEFAYARIDGAVDGSQIELARLDPGLACRPSIPGHR